MPGARSELPKPVGLALILCDNVYFESGGKKALVGLFNQILARKFPALHPRLCVFVSMTEVLPGTQCSLDIVHGETDQAVFQMDAPLSKEAAPTAIWDMLFTIENIPFPEPGPYFVRFFGNGRIMLQRPVELVLAKPERTKEDEET